MADLLGFKYSAPNEVEVYASKGGSDARIESLRSFQLAFIDEFAVPGQTFQRRRVRSQSE